MPADNERVAIARRIVRETFNLELVPTTDVSQQTSNPINQAMFAQRMNNAGANVTFGTKYRWTNVDPSDIEQCKIFGHFYGLAYAHLSVAIALDLGEAESVLVALADSGADLGGLS